MDKEKIAEILTPDNFRAWVLERSDEVYMMNSDPNTCPLAHFIHQHDIWGAVYPTGIYLDDDEIEMPEWAEEFIVIIDNYSISRKHVSKEEVIEALDEALARHRMA